MQREQTLKWLFLDLNSYFASVEQQENPALRGKPVAVVPADTPFTSAIAASAEAKAYGVKTGTMIKDAKRMCPGLICVPAHHDLYVRYHNRIIEEVVKHTPINQIWSIDEFDSCLPPSKRSEEKVRELSARIKHGIWNNIGRSISCSIGVAPTSLLGKIASDMQKPDGLVILHADQLPGRLLELDLTDLPGIGVNMERRLHRAGITTMAQFWDLAPKHARKIWGGVQGERFWYRVHGYEIPHQETNKSMIGHSRVLDPAMRTPDMARLMARRLLGKAVSRLRSANLYAGVLSLGVTVQLPFEYGAHYAQGEKNGSSAPKIRWSGEIRINPANDPFTFLGQLDPLWDEMRRYFAEVHNMPNPRFKKVSTLLLALREKGEITGDLFDQPVPEKTIQSEKQQALAKALDALQSRYKSEVVTFGVPPKTLAGYVGTKIAFNRVPDESEFWT